MCDLSATCVLLLYSFLCFSMGVLNASLIKSASPSSGLLLCGTNGGSRCQEEGGETLPNLTFLSNCCSSVTEPLPFKQSCYPLRFTERHKKSESVFCPGKPIKVFWCTSGVPGKYRLGRYRSHLSDVAPSMILSPLQGMTPQEFGFGLFVHGGAMS